MNIKKEEPMLKKRRTIISQQKFFSEHFKITITFEAKRVLKSLFIDPINKTQKFKPFQESHNKLPRMSSNTYCSL